MIDKKNFANFDFPLLIVTIFLSIIGIFAVYQASNSHYLKMQSLWFIIGLGVMAVVIYFDYKDFKSIIYLIYGANILLLLSVMFFGKASLGAQRWIQIGAFRLQPSEFAKVAIIITLSYLMSREELQINSLLDLIRPGIHVAVPMVLIFLQPDLGTSLVFIAIMAGMLFVAGLKWRHIVLLGILGVLTSIFAYYKVLEEYQINRLIAFTDPFKYYHTIGFQIVQSLIAIGSGGIWGNWFTGSNPRYDRIIPYDITDHGFVPEPHTDFIFSVIGEKFGLIGTTIVLMLFLFMIYRILQIALTASDEFGTFICVGVASMLAFQILVNVGMTLSIMPVTGLPLPFISYGGSNFLSNCIAIGLVLNVALRRERDTIF
ncbi:rod shape-determining protein RodA [Anaerobranca gottschalkii]|uniref:Peptidoglycan glycosyltransferase RodA n=1 Tax=Anaerobranca gottschalkii DSM 13577 TaxID=1120990 RepID=A0A1H9YB23_9FIRM|nr:rod shape-determining protein RodA [Anaerobranca gottschalkii]SES66072.1 rod shape determining protein RodA [Anaerobranca gottschalkii DSM 13577]